MTGIPTSIVITSVLSRDQQTKNSWSVGRTKRGQTNTFKAQTDSPLIPGSVESIANKCGRKPPFFPKEMKHPICTFYQQSSCIAPLVVNFDYDLCMNRPDGDNCYPECSSFRHIAGLYNINYISLNRKTSYLEKSIDSFHNALYRTEAGHGHQVANMQIRTATMVIYMTEVDEVCYTDPGLKSTTCPGPLVRTYLIILARNCF